MKGALTRFFHDRAGAAVLMLVALAAVWFAAENYPAQAVHVNRGFGLMSPNQWLPAGWISLGVNFAVNVAIALLMVYLNRVYNLLRGMSMLGPGMFLILQASTPDLMEGFYGGTLLALLAIVVAAILFDVYGQPGQSRSVFLAFFLIALTAMTQYAAIALIPLALIGCAQMRVLSWRTFVAALLGMITPAWILVGFGLINYQNFTLPTFTNFFSQLNMGEIVPLVATIGVTILLGITCLMGNFIRFLSYNSRTRACNGFMTVLMIGAALLAIFDFYQAYVYVPLLNCAVAYQVGHLFATHRTRASAIPILTIIIVYSALYLWNLTA
ncbi:MAG: hypothetical protein LIP02_05380 [Bacteroidales bacterium]|nr:hypothetical protein [Bacteroidales bacterium]